MKVHLIVEHWEQPPIDTRAKITHEMVTIDCPELFKMLTDGNKPTSGTDHGYRVIGAVPGTPNPPHEE